MNIASVTAGGEEMYPLHNLGEARDGQWMLDLGPEVRPRYFVRDENNGDIFGQYRQTTREEYIRLTGDTSA